MTTIRLAGLVFCIVLTVSMVAAPAAGHGEQEEEFLVDLDASGDAQVYLTLTYELDNETERGEFRELQENATAREEAAERFENRMSVVAGDASNATGREMAVGDADVEIMETVDHGVVTLTVSWEHLASVDGDRLTLTEPFSSGIYPEKSVVVANPEGYERISTTPEPSSSTRETATWDADVGLQGFELVTEPVPDTEASPTDGTDDADDADGADADGAGFGIVAAVGALLGGLLLATRARSHGQ